MVKSFFGFIFLNILDFFLKYFCTNIFYRRSLYTFYGNMRKMKVFTNQWKRPYFLGNRLDAYLSVQKHDYRHCIWLDVWIR